MYNDDTSSVTSKVPGGGNGSLLSLLIKSVVSRIKIEERLQTVVETSPLTVRSSPSGHYSKTR